MRILDIPQSYVSENPTDIGGIFIHRQFKLLASKGWAIHVIHPQPLLYRELKGTGADYPFKSTIEDINILRPRYLLPPFISRNAGIWLEKQIARVILRTIRRQMVSFRPNLVIADWLIPGGYAAAQVAQQYDIPLVVRLRGHDVRIVAKLSQQSQRMFEHYSSILQSADDVICQGEGLLEQIIETGLVEKSKPTTLTNGVDAEYFSPTSSDQRSKTRQLLDIPATAQVWLFVGTWTIGKGTYELQLVIPQLLSKFPDALFIVAGPIMDKRAQEILERSSNRVRFLGAIEPSQIREYMRASDVFILPSHREGLPNALLEAMSCGLVAIASPVDGIPYVLKDGVNGLHVPPGDANRLAEIILRVASDLEHYRFLGIAARNTIFQQGLSVDSVVNQLHQQWSELVKSKNAILY